MKQYDTIVLSPHLDDAALSCGGLIARRTAAGRPVLVVTLMAGDPPRGPFSPFAQGQHASWRLGVDAARQRRMEDAAACDLLGADVDHWPVADCIYRRDPDTAETYYNSDDDLFGQVAPAEAGLLEELRRRLAALPPARVVIAPLTVGGHVDHQLTRQAAERVWGDDLLYYEDYPYARTAGAVEQLLVPAGRWQPHPIPLSPADLARKIAAVAAYRSQVDMFFAGPADLEQQIRSYAARVGGERLWELTA